MKKTAPAIKQQHIWYSSDGKFAVDWCEPNGLSTIKKTEEAGEIVYQDRGVTAYAYAVTQESHVHERHLVPYRVVGLETPAGRFSAKVYDDGRTFGCCWGSELPIFDGGDGFWYVVFNSASPKFDEHMRFGKDSQVALAGAGVKAVVDEHLAGMRRKAWGSRTEYDYMCCEFLELP